MRKEILEALISPGKLRLLSALVQNPSQSYRMADLADELSVTPSTLQRPLQLFRDVEILSVETVRSNVFYRLNPQSDVYNDILSLVGKWKATKNKLFELFKGLQSKVKVAFVYGEFVDSPEAFSEIQVFAIGEITPQDCLKNLSLLEEYYGVDINPEFYSEKQMRAQLKKNKKFFKQTLESARVFLVGEEKVLKELNICQ